VGALDIVSCPLAIIQTAQDDAVLRDMRELESIRRISDDRRENSPEFRSNTRRATMPNSEMNKEMNEMLTDISASVTPEEISQAKEASQRVGEAYAACNRGLVVYHEDSCSKDEY